MMAAQFPWLTAIILLPLVASIFIPLLPDKDGKRVSRYAATKFLLYTAAASVFILIAALAMAFYGGGNTTFDLVELARKNYPLALELPLYAGLMIAFGVKLAVFPLHTWLPDAHGEASSPISMILAGVLLKMGGYGLIRVNLEMLPDAHVYWAPVADYFSDARPREVFIAACFLVLIIGIGFYPKLANQVYDVKTVAVNAQVRQSYIQRAQTNPQLYAEKLLLSRTQIH